MTHIIFILVLLCSWWGSSLEWLFLLLLVHATWSLALSILLLWQLILVIKCEHFGWFIIVENTFIILLHLMLQVWTFLMLLLLRVTLIVLAIWSLEELVLEVWSLNVLTIVICISKSFCSGLLHSWRSTHSFRPLRSMSRMSQGFPFFYSLVYIS
jgi:hypothetical protein